ncbi:MAG: non-heme iron oxygenase ferredoxin subunit [Hyphomonadaceae bacterium]|nr:non-heme iron oxygenase ferredoxin subunit [Hyphomonadaceae bacterium]
MQLSIGSVASLQDGDVERRIASDGRAVAVYRVRGVIYATDDKCSHGAASLSDGFIEGDLIECPAHGGQFHIPTGLPRCFPVVEAVRAYLVEVRDGVAYIEV